MAFGPNTWLALAGYACIAFAWWAHGRDRTVWAIALLALGAGLLRSSPALDPTLHPWDEHYHALVAKRLTDDPFKPTLYADPNTPHIEGSWAHGHVWLNRPPLPLWSIAASL